MKTFLKKHTINFSKYTLVGGLATLFNIFFVWLLIDVFNIVTAVASGAVVLCVILFKFYSYISIGLIKNNPLKFIFIQILSGVLNVFLTWVFIDIFLIPTVISTIVVVGGLFLARYVFFQYIWVDER